MAGVRQSPASRHENHLHQRDRHRLEISRRRIGHAARGLRAVSGRQVVAAAQPRGVSGGPARARCGDSHARASRPQRLSAAARAERLSRQGVLHRGDTRSLRDSAPGQRAPAGGRSRIREPARFLQTLARPASHTTDDAERALTHLEAVELRRATPLGSGLRFEFLPAGHILGPAMVRINDGPTSLLFSGDLGRPQDPGPARVSQQPDGGRCHARL